MDANPTSPEPAVCPRCGATLSRHSLKGLCRRCLARYSLAQSDAARPPDTGLRIGCPQCGHRVELGERTDFSDIRCDSCGTHFSIVDEQAATQSGTRLSRVGPFEVLGELGTGASGTVWKARDTRLDRVVAIKVPRRGRLEPAEVERFLREARAAAQLRHPNIVSVFEVGRDEDLVYIVCDFVEGVSLADWLTGKRVNPRDAARLCRKIASALEHAHGQGVIHRDIKPGNILLDAAGQPHLTDFGLARREVGEVTVTLDGQVLGTPAYMSPEQARGEAHQADPRTDLYSLGVVLFQLLTDDLPFRGNTRMLVQQVIHDDPPSPRKLNAHVPHDLETICLKCLEKEPARRYGSARQLGQDLDRFLAGEPIFARPIGLVSRLWRWCRRKPTLAAMTSALVLLVGIELTGGIGKWFRAEPAAAAEPSQATSGDKPPGRTLGQPPIAGTATTMAPVPTDPTHYVWLDSPDPRPPYTNWATAARAIQDAIDAAAAGDEIAVTNGVYTTGGRAAGTNQLPNRVAADKPVVLRSVNGPEVTLIEGAMARGGGNGEGAVRCVYLANGAILDGFTLTNGATHTWSVGTLARTDQQGGGVLGESTNALVINCALIANTCGYAGAGASRATLSHCALIGNAAFYDGGGAAESVLHDCAITGNTAGMTGAGGMPIGGGAFSSTLIRCQVVGNSSACEAGGAGQSRLDHCTLNDNWAPYGGGAWGADLNNCTLTGNAAGILGGGAVCATLSNCVLTGNKAAQTGGGVVGGWQGELATLNNCTLTGNSAPIGGGATDCTLNNCILYGNNASEGPNYSGGTLNNCCTTPLPPRGDDNIALDPQLADASHLSPASPCRGTGSTRYLSGVDIDGEPWADPPSIGCDEIHDAGRAQ